MLYIDIHTHHHLQEQDVFKISNVIAGKELPPAKSFYSIGVHPWYLNDLALKKMPEYLLSKQCLAIGECGLDLMPAVLDKYSIAVQKSYFLKQVALSEQYQKPLIIHCVKCFDKLLQFKKQINPKQPWIIHGYTKNKTLAEQLINAGFYLSFGAAILKKQTNQLALKHLPINKVFFETDDAPNSIKEVYGTAATILQISLKELQAHVTDNFMRVFSF